jgi:hypothetical protein
MHMRKLVPAFVLTSIVALSSGAAFAFGDMNKAKKTTSADVAATQTAPKASDETTKPSDPAQPNPAMPSASNSAAVSGSVAATNGATAMPEACKGLTPNDEAWKANNCGVDGGSTAAPATSSVQRSDSLSGDSASPSTGSSAPGSSGPSK